MATDFDNLQDNVPPEDPYTSEVARRVPQAAASEELKQVLTDRFFTYLPERLAKDERREDTLATREGVDREREPDESRDNKAHQEATKKEHAEPTQKTPKVSSDDHAKTTRPAPSLRLENLAAANLTNRHLLEVYRHLERRLEKKIDQATSQTLSEKTVKRLLDDHLTHVQGLLDQYFAARETPSKSWRQRLGDYSHGLSNQLKTFKVQTSRGLQAVKSAPIRVKAAVQDRLIDGFVHLNGRIAAHADAMAQRLARARSVPKEVPSLESDRLAQAYKRNYQKVVFNDFVGRAYYPVDTQALATGETVFAPSARAQLRREALEPWLKQGPALGHGMPGACDAARFHQAIASRAETLEALRHAPPASVAKAEAALDQDLGSAAPDVHALQKEKGREAPPTPERDTGPAYMLPPRATPTSKARAAAAARTL